MLENIFVRLSIFVLVLIQFSFAQNVLVLVFRARKGNLFVNVLVHTVMSRHLYRKMSTIDADRGICAVS